MTAPTQADRPVDPADIEAVARALQGAFAGYLGYGDASELAVAAIDTLIARGNHASQAAPTTIPADVLRALDRMCVPLHESRLAGATAEADAHCMKIIRDYIFAASEARDVGELTDEQILETAKLYMEKEDGPFSFKLVPLVLFVRRLLATRASEAAPVAVGDAKHLVTLDRRDLFDLVRGLIHDALNDGIPPSSVKSWAWQEASDRVLKFFNEYVDPASQTAPGAEIANAQRSIDSGIAQVVDKEFWNLTDSASDAAKGEPE